MPTHTVRLNRDHSSDNEDSSPIAHLDVLKQRITDGRGTKLGIEIAETEESTLRRLDFLLNSEGRTVLDFNGVEEEDMEHVSQVKDQLLAAEEGSDEQREIRRQLGKLLS